MLCIIASTSVTQSATSQYLVHIGSITFFNFEKKCILSIPTLSILTSSTKWELTKWEIDQMGIDEVGIGKVGMDKVGRYHDHKAQYKSKGKAHDS